MNTLITQSMSRKANCWENTVAESLFKPLTLKVELVYHDNFKTTGEAKLAVFEYIEDSIIKSICIHLWDIKCLKK